MSFIQNSLFIEESFGEGVVLLLDSLSFPFPCEHVQTCWALLRVRDCSLLSWVSPWSGDYTAPLAATDLHQLIQQNLVVFIDSDILFVGHEFLGLHSVDSVLAHLTGDVLCLPYGLVGRSYVSHLLMVLVHFVFSQQLQSC